MTDPITLQSVLLAGSLIMADAAVKEATKDAYQKVKMAFGEIFGRRGSQTIKMLEIPETRQQGQADLEVLTRSIREDEITDLQPVFRAFVEAMRQDQEARTVISKAKINLDLEVVGNVHLGDIQNAGEINVKAKAGGDFTLTGVHMDPGGRSGN